jgi:dihydroorotase
MLDVILRGGSLVSEQGVEVGDLGISGGKVVEKGDLAGREARDVVDAAGRLVLPGVIDTQVHFREPGLEHKEDLESGTRAAIFGGVTTIFEMPNTQPPTTTAEALEDKLKRAEGRAWCDYAFFVGASPENAGNLARLEQLPGTPGVKIFMGSSTGSLLVDDPEVLRMVLENGERPCPVHSEDEQRMRERKALLSADPHPREHPFLRDPLSAVISTKKLIELCRQTGRPVHILHISTADELPLIKAAKEEGLPVTCEATPQHLSLEASLYETLGSRLQMNPPIRDESHRAAIFRALEEDLFDVIGSDHAPHTLEEKAQPYPKSPSGMPGVQTLLPVMLTWAARGALSYEKLARLTSAAPARLYGIADKGALEPGFDADLVVLDPGRPWTIGADWLQSKCGWSPYEGWEIPVGIERVMLRGETQIRDGSRVGKPSGRPVRFHWKT